MEKLIDTEGWVRPQRQSPAAIFILLMQTIGSMLKALWPILIVSIFRERKPEKEGEEELSPFLTYLILTGVIVILLLPIVLTLLKYWFYKFHIDKDKLIIQSGWLKKKTLTVPLQNIHAVHLEQNLLQQVLKVTKVTIDSAGSEKVEAKIEAISIKKAEQLKSLLLSKVNVSTEIAAEEKVAKKMQTKLSHADLFKLSLSSNHLEAFFIIISLSLNLIDDLKDAFKIDSWDIMETYAMQMAGQTTVMISIVVIAVALISILVSIIRTLIKFYNFTIEDIQQGWKISFGLINQQQKIIPSNKIQILSWKANWLRRKIDFWIIYVQSIGHTGAKHKQHIQIPASSFNAALSLAPVYQQSPVFDASQGQRIEADYWKTKTLIVGVPVTIIVVTIFYLWVGITGIVALLLLAYFAVHYYKSYKVFRWHINNEGLQLYTGVWGRKFTLLTWKKVQQVQMNQTPYQRSHELATITFFTAGGKVLLPFIKAETAKYLADLSLYYVESREENWM